MARYTFFSDVAAGEHTLSEATATLFGTEDHEEAGRVVAGVGDVNGDGYGDFATSSWAKTIEYNDVYQPVAATLVYGPVAGTHNLEDVGVRFVCSDPWPCYGDAVGTGDLDGDGFDDFALAMAWIDAVTLWYGPVEGTQDPVTAPITLYGDLQSCAGLDMDTAGDVDGDGRSDLLVGGHRYAWPDAGMSGVGAAYLLYGRAL